MGLFSSRKSRPPRQDDLSPEQVQAQIEQEEREFRNRSWTAQEARLTIKELERDIAQTERAKDEDSLDGIMTRLQGIFSTLGGIPHINELRTRRKEFLQDILPELERREKLAQQSSASTASNVHAFGRYTIEDRLRDLASLEQRKRKALDTYAGEVAQNPQFKQELEQGFFEERTKILSRPLSE